MPTKEETYIQRIADLEHDEAFDEAVANKVDLIDDLLTGHDALKHFKYDGADDPEEQGKFLRGIRNLLAIRFDEIDGLGHKSQQTPLVLVDQLLNRLDLLLEVKEPRVVRNLIAGDLNDLVEPKSIFSQINELCGRIDTEIEEITTGVAEYKLRGMDKRLKDFDEARAALKKEIDSIEHPALRKLLATTLCAAGDRFAGSKTYSDAKSTLDSTLKTGLFTAWGDAKQLAEQSFGYFTESASGKSMPLSAAVKLDDKFDKALQTVDEKTAKGEDATQAKEEAGKLAQAALGTLDKMPEKLKTATPSFFGKLQSTVFGIAKSLTGD